MRCGLLVVQRTPNHQVGAIDAKPAAGVVDQRVCESLVRIGIDSRQGPYERPRRAVLHDGRRSRQIDVHRVLVDVANMERIGRADRVRAGADGGIVHGDFDLERRSYLEVEYGSRLEIERAANDLERRGIVAAQREHVAAQRVVGHHDVRHLDGARSGRVLAIEDVTFASETAVGASFASAAPMVKALSKVPLNESVTRTTMP